MAALYPLTLTLMLLVTPIHLAGKRVDQYVEVLKDLVYLLKGGNAEGTSESILSNGKSGIKNSKKIQSVVSRLVGGLKTLGVLPPKNLPSFLTASELDGKRLSGFLYNVSLYLQNSDHKEQGDDGIVLNFLNSDVEEVPPPRAILEMRDLFISLRASRNMDSLIELLQNILNLFTRQQLSNGFFKRQNWEVIITLIETVFQTLLSGKYGHIAAGIQGLVCSMTGQSNCGFNMDWLHNLGKFFDRTNWKPVVNFQSSGLHSSSSRLRPWIVPPEAERDGSSNPQSPSSAQSPNTVQNLFQMLSKPNSRRAGSEEGYSVNRSQQLWSEEVLWEGLEELGQNILRKVGTSVYKNFKRKVSRMTGSLVNEVSSVIGIPQSDSDGKCSVGDLRQLLLWGIRNNISWNAPRLGFSSRVFLTGPPFLTCTQPSDKSENTLRNHHKLAKRSKDPGEDTNDALYIEILEAVCNESIPGLPGISNFTIYLYCNLLNRSFDAAHPSPDIRATCSDAAWYLSAVEEDFYWVQVCSQFYATEFNSTVCTNVSLLSQQDLKQPWIVQLCARLHSKSRGGSASLGKCDRLSEISNLNLEVVQKCILPNSTEYLQSLCSNGTFLKSIVGNKTLILLLCNQLDALKKEISSVFDDNKSDEDYLNSLCSKGSLLKSMGGNKTWIDHVCTWLSNRSGANSSKCDMLFDMPDPNLQVLEECILHLGVGYVQGLCLNNTLLKNSNENKGWIQPLCAHMTSAPKPLNKCNGPEILDITLEELQECIFQNGAATLWSLCSSETLMKSEEQGKAWIIDVCSQLEEVKKELGSIYGRKPQLCNYKTWSSTMFTNATLLEICKDWDDEGLKETICWNTTLFRSVLQTHPWVLNYCSEFDKPQEEKCFLQHLLDVLPIPFNFNTTQLCSNPTAFVIELLDRFSRCDDEAFGWISNANYILRVLEFVLDFSGLDQSGKEVQDELSEAILLSNLLDNTSFWASFQPNASVSILQTVDTYLKKEKNIARKNDLLSCFSPVLWDLLQTEDSPTLRVLFQEYLQMPQETFRKLVMSAESETVKKFLSHMHRTWHQMQVDTVSQMDEPALETLTASFLHKFPKVTPDLFVDLSQFIPFMTSSDIMSFPVSLLLNNSVLAAIRDHSSEMKPTQKKAFAKRLLNVNTFGDVSSWPPYFLSSVQPLLSYLPLCHFQQLTAQQLMTVIDQFGNTSLAPSQGRHLIRTVLSSKRNIPSDEITRLGRLICFANYEQLHFFLSAQPYSEMVSSALLDCLNNGTINTYGGAAHMLAAHLRRINVSALNNWNLLSLGPLLPVLGVRFLKDLPEGPRSRLVSSLGSVEFPPAQMKVDTLCRLGYLLSGVSPDVLRTIPGPVFARACACLTPYLTHLSSAQKAALLEVLRSLGQDPGRSLIHFNCLNPFVPLKDLSLDLEVVLGNLSLSRDWKWSQQQAQFIFQKIGKTSNMTQEFFLLKILENLSNESMRSILDHLTKHPERFLRLPSYKRTILAEKVLQLLGVASVGEVSGEVLDNMGPILTYVDEETIKQINQPEFLLRLDDIKRYCIPEENRNSFGRMLIETNVLGDASFWTLQQVEHVDRLVFMLPAQSIHQIPKDVLTLETVEMVLRSQGEWDRSDIGSLCQSQQSSQARTVLLSKKQSLASKAVKSIVKGRREPVPKCVDIKVTFPAAWSSGQLAAMDENEFTDCLEIVTWDKDLSVEHLKVVLSRAKQVYGPVKTMEPWHILALGRAVTQLSDKDLQDLDLSDLGILSFLGEMEEWNTKQRKSAITSVLRWSQRSVSDLDSTTLTALGHLICGMTPTEIKMVNPEGFSEAVLFVGKLRLRCSEAQLQALATLTAQPQAFGLISEWGPEIFTEIGSISAGLPDIVLSSLVKPQIEGLSATAISLMGPNKFAVVFSPGQLSCFTSDQAAAVTLEQYDQLDTEQRQAINAAQYEGDGTQESRGRNNTASTSVKHLVLFLCLFVASWKL
eukprot:gi/632939193/ref/XP_007908121.1/ PREDICTED: stereocilin [Callorhinchus milii]